MATVRLSSRYSSPSPLRRTRSPSTADAQKSRTAEPQAGLRLPARREAGTTVDVNSARRLDAGPQFFVLDSRVADHRREASHSPLLVRCQSAPRRCFCRANNPPLTLPADLPPGPVQWAVAGAAGRTQTGIFWVGANRSK